MLGSILLNYTKKVFTSTCSSPSPGSTNSVTVTLFLRDTTWHAGYLTASLKWSHNGTWKCGVWKVKGDAWSVNRETWRVRVIRQGHAYNLSRLTLSPTRFLSSRSLACSWSHWLLIPSTLSITTLGSWSVSCRCRTTSCPVSFVFASW